MKLLLVLTLSSILLICEGSNIKNNDRALESLMNEMENGNTPTENIITCISNAVKPNEEQYVDMIYFELFNNYIENPCDEIGEIWFDDLDLITDHLEALEPSDIDISFLSEWIVNEYPQLFELIFTWFNNSLFPNDSESHIKVALNILSWINERKTKYASVKDWCFPGWKQVGLTIYSNIVTECFPLGFLDGINNRYKNIKSQRRLVGDDNTKNKTLGEQLRDLQEKCIKFANKGLNIALEANFKLLYSFSAYPIAGLSLTGGVGAYLTLDGIAEVKLYWTVGFGADVVIQTSQLSGMVQIDFIYFTNGNSGEDYMGWNMLVEGGFSYKFGLNGRAIFSWESWDPPSVKFLGWAAGLELSLWSSELHVEAQPILYTQVFKKFIDVNLTAKCEKICTGEDGARNICDENFTIGSDIFNNNNTIQLFEYADLWTPATGEWDIKLATENDKKIRSVINEETSSNSDSIFWVGDNSKESLNWESYSVTVDLFVNEEMNDVSGFIFGAKDVNNAYFFGIDGKCWSMGCYNNGEYTEVDWDCPYKFAKNGIRTISATLYSNGSVIVYDGMILESKILNKKNKDGTVNTYFKCDNLTPKGSVGLRVRKGDYVSFSKVKVVLNVE